ELFAYKPDCLTPPMQDFLATKLKPVLDGKESLRLAEAIGKWPDYPLAIQELAERHQLRAPWFTLPPGEKWDGYRVGR
ncbi:MAG: hypothetical protein NZO58_07300, partial [Gemmataceae bacterium]|nr:hypothetical protein [Gemmataceae bacterium]